MFLGYGVLGSTNTKQIREKWKTDTSDVQKGGHM